MKHFYLAYGSNLNVRQMKLRCPTARVVGTAEIKDYELLFKGSKTGSYLTIEPKEGGIVPVAVWEVQTMDEASLNRYEGFPKFYYKKDMEIRYKGIRTGRHRTVTAFVYIMHEDREIGIPSNRYISTCIEGYNDFGFNLNILFDAVDRSIPNE
ncbi:MAG: gamma-glutamylcyclotransferase [Clostridia bacterium]|nr:gamma-glutamylcyclotransferase [Clostridia bacterium]